ncbi:Spy/CpxP family protein refolding chaperone [Winogradskyella sp. 3972H.M.0a.05]|uniref:Spy/CpxP family protein refolding chaperone n=1 Tax=Winogradskyella sp. 3972H.M.0a.05 TaxID=2950277 RepID=UPI003396211E
MKNRILYILLGFLIIANGFFLYQFFDKPKKRGQKPELFMVKELGFSEKQMQDFRVMSDLHFDQMQHIAHQIRRHKDELFSKIGNDSIDERDIDSLTKIIGDLEKEKDAKLFHHLRKVRALCNDEQKAKFETIMKDALRRGARGPRGPGPKGDRPPPRH